MPRWGCQCRAPGRRLVAVAVDGGALDACLAQAPADGVGAVLAAHKDNHTLGALAMQDLDEGVVLGLVRDGQHVLVNRLGGRSLVRNLDAHGVVDQRLCVVQNVIGERCREEQSLARVGQEAHVEHAVRLVQNQGLYLREVAVARVDEVDKAPRRGNHQVTPLAECGALRLVRDTAYEDRCRVPRACAYGVCDLLDLGGKLARGRDHKHERPLPVARVAQAVECGKQEGGRLAGAGLCGGHDVGTCENGGN